MELHEPRLRGIPHFGSRHSQRSDDRATRRHDHAEVAGPWRGPSDGDWMRRLLRGAGLSPEPPAWLAGSDEPARQSGPTELHEAHSAEPGVNDFDAGGHAVAS